jgi:hypothetical protein
MPAAYAAAVASEVAVIVTLNTQTERLGLWWASSWLAPGR